MALVTTTWEIEVEYAEDRFHIDHDERAFRERMDELGFDAGEIERRLEAMTE